MISYNRLGDVTLQLDDAAAARKYYEQGREISQRLADADPKDVQAARDLMISCNKLSDVTLQVGDVAAALKYCEQGREISQRLADADPKDAQAERDLVISCNKLGNVAHPIGRRRGGAEVLRTGPGAQPTARRGRSQRRPGRTRPLGFV